MLSEHIGVPHLRDLASRSEQISESLSPRDMARLAELFYSTEKSDATHEGRDLDVVIEFLGGMQGYPEINVHLQGTLDLACQRCLGSLSWPLDIDFRLIVVESEADTEEVAEPFDTVVAGDHGIKLVEVIEDELLGSLPLAPMHDEAGLCESVETDQPITEEPEESTEVEMNKPFADLAALMDKKGKQESGGGDN